MSGRYHLSFASGNSKTGPMPVSSSPRSDCPRDCPLYERGCYGLSGRIVWHWKKVSEGERGVTWEAFLDLVRSLPRESMWRHNQVGDLPQTDGLIDTERLRELVRANKGRRGFTYTHHSPWRGENGAAIAEANQKGFTVNLSADGLREADELSALGVGPVVSVISREYGRKGRKGAWLESIAEWRKRVRTLGMRTPAGRSVQVCPATVGDITCAQCGICARRERRERVIVFPAHGNQWRKVERTIEET